MASLSTSLPEIELLGPPARSPRPAPRAPWRAGPLPDVERIGPPAGRAPGRPAPRPQAAPRRTHWPRPPRPLPRPSIAPVAPAPRPHSAASAAVELEIPPFLTRPRPAAPSPTPLAPARPIRSRAPAPRPSVRRRWGGIGVAAVLVAGATALAGLAGGDSGSGPGAPAGARAGAAVAVAEIPLRYLALYQRFGRAMDIDWRFLAAIGAQESDHGRNPWAAVVNSDGCVGPMQLGVGGRCGDFVGAWGVDGDGNGRIDPRTPADAIATAARGLRLGKGAPPVGGGAAGYRRAACAYYGACSDARADYADEVMTRAARYGFTG